MLFTLTQPIIVRLWLALAFDTTDQNLNLPFSELILFTFPITHQPGEVIILNTN